MIAGIILIIAAIFYIWRGGFAKWSAVESKPPKVQRNYRIYVYVVGLTLMGFGLFNIIWDLFFAKS